MTSPRPPMVWAGDRFDRAHPDTSAEPVETIS
jgi:hypothetical protein